MARRKITIKDVAERAGVSVFTVSGVINRSHFVKEETEQRVLAAIRDTGYIPNDNARSMRTQKSNTVGVHFPLFINHPSRAFFSVAAEGVHNVLQQNGYHFLLNCADDTRADETSGIAELVSKSVAGMILAATFTDSIHIPSGAPPIVLIDRDIPELICDRVMNQNYESTFEAVNFLIGKGHTRIGYLNHIPRYSNHYERFEGYCAALEQHGIPYDELLVVSLGDMHQDSVDFAYRGIMRLLEQKVSAVICNTSYGSFGVIKVAEDLGIRIPEDLAVITYDDYEWTEMLKIPLTSIKQDALGMGVAAAELLLERIAHPERPCQTRQITSTLIHRGSA